MFVQYNEDVNSYAHGGVQMSMRAQLFSTYNGKICSDQVVFMPTWVPKRLQDMDLTKGENCEMFSYGL